VLAAHYEISGANLTKSLRIFCCAGLKCLFSLMIGDLEELPKAAMRFS
jgi:hypothetical protein